MATGLRHCSMNSLGDHITVEQIEVKSQSTLKRHRIEGRGRSPQIDRYANGWPAMSLGIARNYAQEQKERAGRLAHTASISYSLEPPTPGRLCDFGFSSLANLVIDGLVPNMSVMVQKSIQRALGRRNPPSRSTIIFPNIFDRFASPKIISGMRKYRQFSFHIKSAPSTK